MVIQKRVVRNGVAGHMVKVAPREGYTRFVADRYNKRRQPRRY